MSSLNLIKNKKKVTLLLIDDEPTSLQMLIGILHHEGFTIITALNGKEGLQIAQQEQPNLILLDVMMPGLNGFETCHCLKANATTIQIPVIFLTVLDRSENKVKGFNIGAVDYITKPVSALEVIARITTHLNQYHIQQNLSLRLYEQRFGPLDSKSTGSKMKYQNTLSNPLAQVWQTRDKLLSNLAYTPSLDELAHIVGTNRNTLSKEFRRHFGISIFMWLREQRLQQASCLLYETDCSIQQISDKLAMRLVTAIPIIFPAVLSTVLVGRHAGTAKKVTQTKKRTTQMKVYFLMPTKLP